MEKNIVKTNKRAEFGASSLFFNTQSRLSVFFFNVMWFHSYFFSGAAFFHINSTPFFTPIH